MKRRPRVRRAGAALLIALSLAGPSVAMDAEERLLFANGLYRRALYDLAIPEFQALRDDPVATNLHDLATFRIGECQRLLGLTNEAAAAYEQVVAVHPNSAFAHRAAFRRAELDWLAGRQKDAMKKFQQLIALNPEPDLEAASLYHLGLCQIGLDRTDDAEKNLRRMVTTHPDSPYADYARLALADVLLQADATSSEASALLIAITDTPASPSLGAEALAKAALIDYRAARHPEAARRFSELATTYPDNTWTATTRLEAGWAQLLAGQPDAALAIATTGIAAATTADQPDWLYLKANIERQSGAAPEALATYESLLKAAPNHAVSSSAAFEACGVAWQLENYPRVLALSDIASGPPERALPLLWMQAGAYRALNDTDRAVAAYTAITRDHADSDRAPAAAYQLALITAERGDSSAAATAFSAIATTSPRHALAADALMASAAAWHKAGDLKAASRSWTSLIDQFPAYPAIDEAHLGRARAEIEMDRTKLAITSLNAVIAASTNHRFLAEAHYLRGTLHEKDDNFAKAEEHYRDALTFEPVASLARQIQFRRVAVLQRQDRNEEAADLMNTLIADGAGEQLPPALLEWLARWNLEKKMFPEAETAATLLAAQGGTPGWTLLGNFIAGTAARAQNKSDAAVAAFERAAAVNLNARENAEAFFQLGQLALEAQRPADAVTHFTRAAERAGTDTMMDIRARSYLQLGIAHEALEQWADASRYYLGVGVLFDDPTLTPESLFRAAGALDAQGQTAQRDRVIAELSQRFPDTKWNQQAGERWPPPTP